MSTKTDPRINDMRVRIDRLHRKFGAVEHAQAEKAGEENQALATVTRDYVNDLEEISRELDETTTATRADARRRAEAARDGLRHTPDRLAERLAELERKADETFKRARPGVH